MTGVENWEDWEEENCLEGRRRRLMRRGTRATREEGGEGERGEDKEDESSLRLVVEKALLLVAFAVWVVVFLRFVCLDRAIPVVGPPLGFALSRSPRRLSSKQIFPKETPLISYAHRCASRPEESTRARDYFRRRFLLVVVGIRCLFNHSLPAHKQTKTTGATECT